MHLFHNLGVHSTRGTRFKMSHFQRMAPSKMKVVAYKQTYRTIFNYPAPFFILVANCWNETYLGNGAPSPSSRRTCFVELLLLGGLESEWSIVGCPT